MKNRLNAAILACAVLLPLAAWAVDSANPGPVPARDPSVRERMAAARKFIDQKNFIRAMDELNAVVERDPDNADAHNLLGYSFRKQPRPDVKKALEHYLVAIKLNPEHKGAHEYIGEAYLMDKKPEQAEKHLAVLEKLCGNRNCEEYRDLAKSIADFKAKN